MVEPQKPFACSDPECGMSFTNEDHLHVHSKKHDMVLQLGLEQKSAFVADQTPTPTRFIRNCEEVGLFQDLNVNPFDEGFKRAIENKHGILCLEAAQGGSSNDDVLHTPQVAFPLLEADSTMYSTNNQRNITISRSSSDETGAIKEYETTTISKLTNEVTTISRVVGKQDLEKTNDSSTVKHQELIVNKDVVNGTQSVSFRNNVIKIHEDVNIKKDGTIINNKIKYADSVIKDTNVNKDVQDKAPPIMSQKSLDFVVDSLTAETADFMEAKAQIDAEVRKIVTRQRKKKKEDKSKDIEDFEAIIKLPGGKRVKMKAVKEEPSTETRDILREALSKKVEVEIDPKPHNILIQQTPHRVIPLGGTLIPVQMNPIQFAVPKVPIPRMSFSKEDYISLLQKGNEKDKKSDLMEKKLRHLSASQRYRQRLKMKQDTMLEENQKLRDMNQKLVAEKAVLKMIIAEHTKKYPLSNDLRLLYEKNS